MLVNVVLVIQQHVVDGNGQEKTRQINSFYDKVKESPQKIFVIKGLKITPAKHRISFSELTTVEGLKLPKFAEPPSIVVSRYYNSEGPLLTAITWNTAKEYLDMEPGDLELFVDIWLY